MTGNQAPIARQQLARGQLHQWRKTFAANPGMYGSCPSEAGLHAIDLFAREGVSEVLELGAGQGRDTLALLTAGFGVTALDFTALALEELAAAARPRLSHRLTTVVHDVREPLPFPDESFDACYSHMLFTMALATSELCRLAAEVLRVLRPGGICIYTVRHVGDPHYGSGRSLEDDCFENGGFVVHFFDRELVDRLSIGFCQVDVTPFEEGELPRRLWRITQRKP